MKNNKQIEINNGVSHSMTTSDDPFESTARAIVSTSWVILLIVTGILLVANLVAIFYFDYENYWYTWPMSYFLGAMTNLFAFNLLKRSLAQEKQYPNSSNYVLRYIIYGLVLAAAYQSDKLNVVFVAIGYLTVRLAIYIYTYRNKG